MGAVVKYAKGYSDLLFSKSTGFVIQKLISLILEGVRQKNPYFCTRDLFLLIFIFLILKLLI